MELKEIVLSLSYQVMERLIPNMKLHNSQTSYLKTIASIARTKIKSLLNGKYINQGMKTR